MIHEVHTELKQLSFVDDNTATVLANSKPNAVRACEAYRCSVVPLLVSHVTNERLMLV